MRRTHGLSNTPLYELWAMIKNRCYNANDLGYKKYGAKGVTMCEEWKKNPLAFISWAKNNGYKKGLQIDKDIIAIKNGEVPNLYSPERCQFVTREENMSRTSRSRFLTYNDRTQTLIEWSREIGIPASTLVMRLDVYGYSIDKAFSKGWRGLDKKNKNTV